MKINLAIAALDGINVKLATGEDIADLKSTIEAAHDGVIHHMRMKYVNGPETFRLYFMIGNCKVYAGGDPTIGEAETRRNVACGFDSSGLLAKVQAFVLDEEYHKVAEFG